MVRGPINAADGGGEIAGHGGDHPVGAIGHGVVVLVVIPAHLVAGSDHGEGDVVGRISQVPVGILNDLVFIITGNGQIGAEFPDGIAVTVAHIGQGVVIGPVGAAKGFLKAAGHVDLRRRSHAGGRDQGRNDEDQK